MIGVRSRGNFEKTRDFINRCIRKDIFRNFEHYGQLGVDALAAATPVDTGLTASCWTYEVIKDTNRPGIRWFNTNMAAGTSVAVLIQYGHATGTGGYVNGLDYINPAIRPIFEQIANEVWQEVIS